MFPAAVVSFSPTALCSSGFSVKNTGKGEKKRLKASTNHLTSSKAGWFVPRHDEEHLPLHLPIHLSKTPQSGLQIRFDILI